MTDLELGWIAGILEGEGSFSKTVVQASVGSTDLDTIQYLCHLLGGNIAGPYQRKSKDGKPYKPIWQWSIRGKKAAYLMSNVYPLMGKRRKEQIDQSLSNYTEARRNDGLRYVKYIHQLPEKITPNMSSYFEFHGYILDADKEDK